MEKNILNDRAIRNKITRLAHEIVENHHESERFVVVGIEGQGYIFAEALNAVLKETGEIDAPLYKITIDKASPEETLFMDHPEALKGATALLVDDVINSGRTMMHAASYLLQQGVNELKTAVLVNRLHRRFPIHANYVGMSLSTTLREHIAVDMTGNKASAFLT